MSRSHRMTWKSYALVSGVGMVATYLVSTPMPPAGAPTVARPVASRTEVASDIEEQAVRLQSRLRRQAPYQEPARNPFRFSQRPTPRQAAVPERVTAAAPVTAPLVPQPPAIVLVGIAEDATAGRTAILKTAAGIVFVRPGDTVSGEYTVRTIEESAVDLVGAGGIVRRLAP